MNKNELIDSLLETNSTNAIKYSDILPAVKERFFDSDLFSKLIDSYQYRDKDFDIVSSEDLDDNITEQVVDNFLRCLIRSHSEEIYQENEKVKHISRLYHSYIKDQFLQTVSDYRRLTKDNLQKIYDFTEQEKENARKKIPEIIENIVSCIPEFLENICPCEVYIDNEEIFKGVIGEFHNHQYFVDLNLKDKVSDRTREDYLRELESQKRETDSASRFYENNKCDF